MGFETLRSLIRPISRAFSTHSSNLNPKSSSQFLPKLLFPTHQLLQQHHQNPILGHLIARSIHLESLKSLAPKPFDPLTNTRFPKRRPLEKPRRKRSSLRPSGPYAWVKHDPGEAVPPSQPNEGSVKLRNEKKRRRQRCEFMKAERKKRKAELQEANRKKREKRIERKMEAAARDRDWAYRLTELEAEKKKSAV